MKEFDYEKLDVYVATIYFVIVAMLVQMVRRASESGTGTGTGTK